MMIVPNRMTKSLIAIARRETARRFNDTAVRMIIVTAMMITLLLGCAEKNPPRDEIPAIKDCLVLFQAALESKDTAGIDSLLAPEAARNGLNSQTALAVVYRSESNGFHSFGGREFKYADNKAIVTCGIRTGPSDPGHPAEILLVRKKGRWLVSQFRLK